MRSFPIAVAVCLIACSVRAGAQTPSSTTLPVVSMPRPTATPHVHQTPRPTAVTTFTNPSSTKAGQTTAGGAVCNRNATAAQAHVNPITGQPQAATIVSVPLSKDSTTIAGSTNRRQQIEACAHPR